MLRFRKRGRDAADLAQAAPSPVSDVDRDVSEIIKKVRLGNLPGELRLAKGELNFVGVLVQRSSPRSRLIVQISKSSNKISSMVI